MIFCHLSKKRVGCGQSLFFEECAFEILKQEKVTVNFAEEIQKLPYIFKDSIKVDKKIDPKNYSLVQKLIKIVDSARSILRLKKW